MSYDDVMAMKLPFNPEIVTLVISSSTEFNTYLIVIPFATAEQRNVGQS